jgi:hypothetical protein
MQIVTRIFAVGAGVCLLAGAAVAAEQKAGEQTAPKEKLICKSIQETGSMARRVRQCFTRQEWERIAEAARARGQRLQSDMASGMTSN